MKNMKRGLLLSLAACMLLVLASCGGINRKDATVYVQGELDVSYKGTINKEYVKIVEDMTEEDAKEKFDTNVAAEAEYLLRYLEVEYPDEAATTKAQDLIREIYAKAQYTVGEADKLQSGDFAVEVTLSPIEIIPLLQDESYADNWQLALAQAGIESQEQLDALSEEDYATVDSAFAMLMLEELESLLPELSYGTDQVVMLQLKLGEDDYYSMVDTGWQKLDEIMIDYYGAYAE